MPCALELQGRVPVQLLALVLFFRLCFSCSRISQGSPCSHKAAQTTRTRSNKLQRRVQVVQVCAEHKKVAKLLKHLACITAASKGSRALPRILLFCNKVKVCRTFASTYVRTLFSSGLPNFSGATAHTRHMNGK